MSRAEDLVDALLVALCIVGVVVATVAYALIFGNTVSHRDGWCGRLYRWLTRTAPGKMEGDTKSVERGLMVMVVGFDVVIYALFVGCHAYYVVPNITKVFGNAVLHRLLPVVLVSLPWVMFFVCRMVDPGVITKENVDGYLELYEFDGCLYTPKQVNGMPAVARSRWCRYTDRLIAYSCFLTPVDMIITALGYWHRLVRGPCDGFCFISQRILLRRATTTTPFIDSSAIFGIKCMVDFGKSFSCCSRDTHLW